MKKPSGLDLHIDKSITEICQAANESSKVTRSVLYALVFISLLVFVAFWNSRTQNWGTLRLNHLQEMRIAVSDSLRDTTDMRCKIKYKYGPYINILCSACDTINYSFSQHKCDEENKKLDDLIDKLRIRNDILHERWLIHFFEIERNVVRVTVPFLGASFDINDLGIVSGISLSILMFIFLFTLDREYNNLMLSFISITNRYDDDSDENIFEKSGVLFEYPPDEKETYLKLINKTRRGHHYNYLSMTEIFNLPRISNDHKRSITERLSTYIIFIVPLIVQASVFYNDLSTDTLGIPISTHVTIMTLIYDAIFLISISFATFHCIRSKFSSTRLWDDFYDNDCKLIQAEFPDEN